MGNRKGNTILITMGLIMVCLFFIAMLHPHPADAAVIAGQSAIRGTGVLIWTQ